MIGEIHRPTRTGRWEDVGQSRMSPNDWQFVHAHFTDLGDREDPTFTASDSYRQIGCPTAGKGFA